MRRKKQKNQPPGPPAPVYNPSETSADTSLPGSAGYRGAARLEKNAMPISRFTFKRPDGKG